MALPLPLPCKHFHGWVFFRINNKTIDDEPDPPQLGARCGSPRHQSTAGFIHDHVPDDYLTFLVISVYVSALGPRWLPSQPRCLPRKNVTDSFSPSAINQSSIIGRQVRPIPPAMLSAVLSAPNRRLMYGPIDSSSRVQWHVCSRTKSGSRRAPIAPTPSYRYTANVRICLG